MAQAFDKKLKLAREAEADDRLEDAFALYRDMQAAEPANVEVLYHFGCLAHSTGNFQAAWQLFLQGMGHAPKDARLHLGLGKARGALADWTGAIRSLEKANQLAPDDTDVLVHLATAYHETAAFDDCLKICELCLARDQAKDPAQPIARNLRGSALMHLGQYEEAIAAFRALVSENPDDGHIQFNLGNACHHNHQYDDALEAYKKAAVLLPVDLDSQLTLGAVAYDLDSPGLAAEAFERAAALAPERADIHAGLARALVQLGHQDDALAAYDRALEIAPDDSILQFERTAASRARIDAAPEDYVIETFDSMAESFDEQLVAVLEYRAPEKLHDAVAAVVGPVYGDDSPNWSIADLGCGTGLCGMLFHDWASHLLGIDLSSAMIKQSKARGIYDELRVESVDDTLRAASSEPGGAFDLIVAADLFIYIGNLEPIFEGSAKALKPGGYFAFSTEDTSGEDFTVNANMRFSQSPEYIRRLADRHGFSIVSAEQSALRTEMRKPVMGTIYLLQKGGEMPDE